MTSTTPSDLVGIAGTYGGSYLDTDGDYDYIAAVNAVLRSRYPNVDFVHYADISSEQKRYASGVGGKLVDVSDQIDYEAVITLTLDELAR